MLHLLSQQKVSSETAELVDSFCFLVRTKSKSTPSSFVLENKDMIDEKTWRVRRYLLPVFRCFFISKFIPVKTVAKIVEDYLKPYHCSSDCVPFSKTFQCLENRHENVEFKIPKSQSLAKDRRLLGFICQVRVQDWKKPSLIYKEIFGGLPLSAQDFAFVRSLYYHCLKRSGTKGHTVTFEDHLGYYFSVQIVLKALTVINQLYLDSVFPNEKK